MTLTSAASTRVAAATGGIDPMPPEPSDRPAAGFELLLADAQGAVPDPSSPSNPSNSSNSSDSTGSQPDGTATDPTTGTASKDSSSSPPAPKPAPAADSTGLLGTLGALAMTAPPVTTSDTPPAPPADATDSAPVTDATTAPPPTVLDLVAAAISASDSSVGNASPAGPQAAPTVETNLSVLLEPAPRDAGTPAPTVDQPPASPAPNIPTPNPMTVSGNSPAPANTSSRPPVVDSAGPPPSDRSRPQAQSASAPSGAATFAAPTQAGTPTAPSADEWTTATATVAPPPPADQLVSVLTPLRTTPTGSYTLRLELKPPEMGRVEMRVEMRDGVLHASIHAEREGAAQLVRDSLGELRDRLNAEGVRTGDLTVSDGGVGPGSHDGEDAPTSGSRSSGTTLATPDDPTNGTGMPTTTTPDSTSLLDVRV
jgi:flagellar hook-length control protein FliK